MKRTLTAAMVVVASIALTAGIVRAASLHNVTSTLGGVAGDYFEVDGIMFVDALKVGEQGVGGVTFFNGTIINQTTDSEGGDIPVTFGDNVRIDGRVYRGATAGVTDDLPFIVNDNMEVVGDLSVDTLTATAFSGDGIVATANVADDAITADQIADDAITADQIADDAVTAAAIGDGAVGTAALAASAVTQATEDSGTAAQTTTEVADDYDLLTTEVDMTTGDSVALVMFSGVLSNDTNNSSARIFLVVDDSIVSHTIRRGTSNTADETFTLAFTALVDVEAGDHTFQVGWNTDDGTTASMYNNTLDVVELKR
ncbi:MAG: hypothetical protein WC505_03960 [Patescibacteria group bacterium]